MPYDPRTGKQLSTRDFSALESMRGSMGPQLPREEFREENLRSAIEALQSAKSPAQVETLWEEVSNLQGQRPRQPQRSTSLLESMIQGLKNLNPMQKPVGVLPQGVQAIRNYLGKTLSTTPGEAFGAEGQEFLGVKWPFTATAPEDRPDPEQVATNLLNPTPAMGGMIIGAKGVGRLGGEFLRRFQEGEKAATGGVDPWRLWKDFGYEREAGGAGTIELPDLPLDMLHTGRAPTSRMVSHPELFEAYPELGQMPATIRASTSSMGAFSPSEQMGLDLAAPTKGMAIPILAHELQHGVQYLEGFPRGGNMFNVGKNLPLLEQKDLIDLLDLMRKYSIRPDDYQRFANYLRLVGETQARNTAHRLTRSPEGNRIMRPEATEDLSRRIQLIRRAGEGD